MSKIARLNSSSTELFHLLNECGKTAHQTLLQELLTCVPAEVQQSLLERAEKQGLHSRAVVKSKWQQLPSTLLIAAFAFLDAQSVLQAERSCRRFRNLGQHEGALQHIDKLYPLLPLVVPARFSGLKTAHASFFQLSLLAAAAPRLQGLTLLHADYNYEPISAQPWGALSSFAQLRRLNLSELRSLDVLSILNHAPTTLQELVLVADGRYPRDRSPSRSPPRDKSPRRSRSPSPPRSPSPEIDRDKRDAKRNKDQKKDDRPVEPVGLERFPALRSLIVLEASKLAPRISRDSCFRDRDRDRDRWRSRSRSRSPSRTRSPLPVLEALPCVQNGSLQHLKLTDSNEDVAFLTNVGGSDEKTKIKFERLSAVPVVEVLVRQPTTNTPALSTLSELLPNISVLGLSCWFDAKALSPLASLKKLTKLTLYQARTPTREEEDRYREGFWDRARDRNADKIIPRYRGRSRERSKSRSRSKSRERDRPRSTCRERAERIAKENCVELCGCLPPSLTELDLRFTEVLWRNWPSLWDFTKLPNLRVASLWLREHERDEAILHAFIKLMCSALPKLEQLALSLWDTDNHKPFRLDPIGEWLRTQPRNIRLVPLKMQHKSASKGYSDFDFFRSVVDRDRPFSRPFNLHRRSPSRSPPRSREYLDAKTVKLLPPPIETCADSQQWTWEYVSRDV